MASRFGAIAADLHVTPTPCTIAAAVEKQPGAPVGSALTDGRQRLAVGQQIRRILGDRPQNGVERLAVCRKLPLEYIAVAGQPTVLISGEQLVADRIEICRVNLTTGGNGRKYAEDGFAQLNRPPEDPLSIAHL